MNETDHTRVPIQRAQLIVRGFHNGKQGTFIRDGDGPISPLFDGLGELYHWMRQRGWYKDEHGTTPNGDAGTFYPWRVAKMAQMNPHTDQDKHWAYITR